MADGWYSSQFPPLRHRLLALGHLWQIFVIIWKIRDANKASKHGEGEWGGGVGGAKPLSWSHLGWPLHQLFSPPTPQPPLVYFWSSESVPHVMETRSSSTFLGGHSWRNAVFIVLHNTLVKKKFSVNLLDVELKALKAFQFLNCNIQTSLK